MPAPVWTVGESVTWMGTSYDYGVSSPAIIPASPGTVQQTSPNLVIMWADGFSLSAFAPTDPDLAMVAPASP